MLKHRVGRPGGARRQVLVVGATLIASLVLLSPALATPTGPYAVFSQCPTNVPGVTLCTFGQTTSGEFTIGKTRVPINKTITLQGGGINDPALGEENDFVLIPAKNGESLSKTELNVPGGLLNLINCEEIKGKGIIEGIERAACKAIFENKTTGVTATTELVANEHNPAVINGINIISEKRVGLTLPVRVHLKNPLLGSGCYIGSEKSPIELKLTTGTTSPKPPNKPIKGKTGVISEEEGVSILTNNTLVDNNFSAPAAEGCGGLASFLIDPIIDAKIGLPAAEGTNTAILSGVLKDAGAEEVIASE